MNGKKILAGVIAAFTAVMSLPSAVIAEDFYSENAAAGSDESRPIPFHYDLSTRRYVDDSGNTVLPYDHHPELEEEVLGSVNLPSSYDTRDVFAAQGLEFPEIKNQVSTGTCWAHSALAAIEINGLLRGKLSSSSCNFSEAHLNYFTKISDKDNSHGVYGDYCRFFTEQSYYDDLFQLYASGANQTCAASVLARGSGPVIEQPEWDIADGTDYLVIDGSVSNRPTIFDTIEWSDLYLNGGYYCYMKDGEEIVLNRNPYYFANNISTDLFYTPFDESVRYDRDAILTDTNEYLYNYTVGDYASVDNIKTAIMENGALTLSYYADTRSVMLSSSNGYYYPLKAFMATYSSITESTDKSKLPSNHTITVIGWDDEYSRDNFYSDRDTYSFTNGYTGVTTTYTAEELRPQSDGAWLCRNSWGSSFGDEGYFYLSYEEPESNEFFSYDIASNNAYGDKIYQYDGVESGYGYICPSGYTIANIFTADAAETLSAVSFFTFDSNADCKISIYRNVEDGKPMSGTLAYSSANTTITHGGYHTIDLDSPITLENGEKFSVVLSTNNTKLYIDTYNTSAGQSFVYFAEGATSYSSFNDTYNYSGNNFNVCLKALTTSSEVEKPDAPTNLSAVPGDGKALLFWEEVDDAEQYTVYYYNTQNDTGYVAIGSVTEPFRMMNTLTNGHAYRFAVTSTVNKVESELSSPIYVTPEAGASIIKIPTGLEAAADSGQVALSWDNMNGAKSYNVYCSTINNKYVNDAICKNVTANSCTITGLTNGTTYYFWVEACYVNGETSLGCGSVSATPKAAEAIVITNQPSSMTVMGGTKFTMSVCAEGTGLAFRWEYNDGNGWKALPSGSNFYYTGGTSAATAAIYNTAEFKDCSFRCVISDSDGNSTVTDSAVLSFYNESNITIGMVESLSTTNLVNYVNYFTTLYSDTFELTAAQLRAIELVLAEDYQ